MTFQPSVTVARNAIVVTVASVMPREKMSCFITFIARETAVQIRYKFTPGIAQSRTESTATMCGSRPNRFPAEPNDYDRPRGDDRALRHREKNSQMKQRPAARSLAGCFRSRDEGNDRVVEAEHPDLAQNIGRRPGDEISAERGRAEKPRDKKSENAAEIRGDERDGVEEHPALEFRAGAIAAPARKFVGEQFGCGRGSRSRNDGNAAARMGSDDSTVLHLVNPIARTRDLWIVRHEEKRFSARRTTMSCKSSKARVNSWCRDFRSVHPRE